MTTTTTSRPPVSTHRRSRVIAVAVAVVIAIAACTAVAYTALAVGADSSFAPLRPAIYAPFAAAGVVAGYLGWSIIAQRAARAAVILRILVPALTVLSFVPDVVLLVTGFIPGTSPTGVVALAVMHVIVVAVVVLLCLRVAPRGQRAATGERRL